MNDHQKGVEPRQATASSPDPDMKLAQMARDAFANGVTTPEPHRNDQMFSWACGWYQAAFDPGHAGTEDDPQQESLRQAFAIARGGPHRVMPSALIRLAGFPHLAQWTAQVVRAPTNALRIQLQIAWLAQATFVSQPELDAAFRGTPWEGLDWEAWADDRPLQRQMMLALVDDDLVADLDGFFGDGSALAMGQRIAHQLRLGPSDRPKLSRGSPVSGSA